jgi:hypothetical protein
VPPPNGTPPVGDPRVQKLLDDMTAAMTGVIQQHAQVMGQQFGAQLNHVAQHLQTNIQQLATTLAPHNRVVDVERRDENDVRTVNKTTNAQLLAELNDNIMDLIGELAAANDLTEKMIDRSTPDAPARAPRRRRKR